MCVYIYVIYTHMCYMCVYAIYTYPFPCIAIFIFLNRIHLVCFLVVFDFHSLYITIINSPPFIWHLKPFLRMLMKRLWHYLISLVSLVEVLDLWFNFQVSNNRILENLALLWQTCTSIFYCCCSLLPSPNWWTCWQLKINHFEIKKLFNRRQGRRRKHLFYLSWLLDKSNLTLFFRISPHNPNAG